MLVIEQCRLGSLQLRSWIINRQLILVFKLLIYKIIYKGFGKTYQQSMSKLKVCVDRIIMTQKFPKIMYDLI